jgi:hypothetical protein
MTTNSAKKKSTHDKANIHIKRVYNVRPDVIDFRDKIYSPSLKEVPIEKPLEAYMKLKLPVLNQGSEGACTGFGLAAVVNYLLKTRKVNPAYPNASPYMLYYNARMYDEWQGENYEGSSARGAMKGWHKHGVCKTNLWKDNNGRMSRSVALDSTERPLGSYYRIPAPDLVAIHCALEEVGILFATASVHSGWDIVGRDGAILFNPDNKQLGGHAFAIVGYTKDGFWIQNSWGTNWGKGGFGLITYEDWLKNANDVWVARLGVPIKVPPTAIVGTAIAGRQSEMMTSVALRPYVISLGNDGELRSDDRFHLTPDDLRHRFRSTETFEKTLVSWQTSKKKIVLYAHGGLVPEKSALEVLADNKNGLLNNSIYPFMFVWHSGLFDSLGYYIKDELFNKRDDDGRAKGMFDWFKDRKDQSIEILTRKAGQELWGEMKENAQNASRQKNRRGNIGGAYLFLEELKHHVESKNLEIHIVCHSAGAIFMGGVVEYLRNANIPIESLSLWAPACTVDFFNEFYLPSLSTDKSKTISGDSHIRRAALYTLSNQQELDDNCLGIYGKSLLYLVSNSYEQDATPFDDDKAKILGMEKFSNDYAQYFNKKDKFIRVVGGKEVQKSKYTLTSSSTKHGDFDNDLSTRLSTLKFIKG